MDADEDRRPNAAETAQDRDAQKWLDLLEGAEKADRTWHEVCDNIDKHLSELEFKSRSGADRQLQVFWANMEVMKPATYTRPPVPVVAPRHQSRESVPRTTAEVLERALAADVEHDDLHSTLEMVRDDMLAAGRGVPWLRMAMRNGRPAVVCDHINREDFRFGPARKWVEVPWVARRTYLSREKGIDRFGPEFVHVQMEEQSLGVGEDSAYKGFKQARVWEIWHREQNVVVWVAENHKDILDIQPPWLDVEGFFPCPKPACATLQRGTLIPVPDFVYYRDQVEEINTLTARISALAESLRLRGFYAAGHGEVGEAVEAAFKLTDDRSVLVPVSNFAALGAAGLKDAIVWLPLREVVETVTSLVALRKQMMEDVYEITGLSDIMRGTTQASETATAQQLKAQYGSIRVQTKQAEMQRVARDVLRIKAEIMAEQIPVQELLAIGRVADIPTQQQVDESVARITLKAAAAAQQGDQGAMQKAQAAAEKENGKVTVEQVAQLLMDQRVRPFAIEVETDSTIAPDENAEKERRVEFLTSVGGFIQTAAPTVMQFPEVGPFVAEALRFAAGAFRAGRAMDDAIDELADRIQERSEQPQQADPMQQAMAEAEVKETTAKAEKASAEAQKTMREANAPDSEPVSVDPLDQFRAQTERMKATVDMAAQAAAVVQKDAEIEKGPKDG
ncbi:MAG: hypothetical protein AAF762_00285 [Pseudomonadota bacterium]